MSADKLTMVAWIGITDVKCAQGYLHPEDIDPENVPEGIGPLRTLIEGIDGLKELILLSTAGTEKFVPLMEEWIRLCPKVPKLKVIDTHIVDPSDYVEVYATSLKVFDKFWKADKRSSYIFHLSPGTPTTTAVFLYLTHVKFPGGRVYSTVAPKYLKEGQSGVREVKLPFMFPINAVNTYSEGSLAEERQLKDLYAYAEYKTVNIMLLGEPGVGKSELARKIHNDCRQNKEEKLVEVDCAELAGGDDNMFRSALFGYERGAYTGATDSNEGYLGALEKNGGTLFFDEIAELPLKQQSILLKLLQNRKYLRLGARDKTPREMRNVRFICATNQDIESMVREGRFRSDLYYRLNTYAVRLKPLRSLIKESSDILSIKVKDQIDLICSREPNLNEAWKVSSDAMLLMENYTWPGNLRELYHVMLLACISAKRAGRREILPEDIKDRLYDPLSVKNSDNYSSDNLALPAKIGEITDSITYRYLNKALEQEKHNMKKACKLVGMSYDSARNFMNRMKKESTD
ncbi:MAG: sigma-54-dependent Fis family transcriptional regulator [Succinivibrio sp.]|nr:sigma-54-dependent Fis family transcriptional regulator [Succinivibrio sp.]